MTASEAPSLLNPPPENHRAPSVASDAGEAALPSTSWFTSDESRAGASAGAKEDTEPSVSLSFFVSSSYNVSVAKDLGMC